MRMLGDQLTNPDTPRTVQSMTITWTSSPHSLMPKVHLTCLSRSPPDMRSMD